MPPVNIQPSFNDESEQSINTSFSQRNKTKLYVVIPASIMVLTFFGIIFCLAIYANSQEGIISRASKKLDKVKSFEGTFTLVGQNGERNGGGTISADYSKKIASVVLVDTQNNTEMQAIIDGDNFYTRTYLIDNKTIPILQFSNKWIKSLTSETEKETSVLFINKISPIYNVPKIDKNWFLETKGGHYTLTKTSELPTGVKSYVATLDSKNLSLNSIEIKTADKDLEIIFTKTNQKVSIAVPEDFLTVPEWKDTLRINNLLREKIKEINIFHTEDITNEEINLTKKAIKKYYSIDANVQNTLIIPQSKRNTLYIQSRNQFDGDALWDYFSKTIPVNSTSTLNILLTGEDMYSSKIKNTEYVFSRALPGINTIIISTKHLQDTNVSNSNKNLKDRITKIVVRTVGVSVSFTYSSDVKNKMCILYQATTTEELDTVGDDLCPVAKELVPLFFEKS